MPFVDTTTAITHRPYPLPTRRWAMAMQWRDLLFMHWCVRPEVVRARIPPMLEVDTFDGDAWIAVVPFRMAGMRPRSVPALPRVGVFPELNLRTYVRYNGRPGVWFWSLDAADPLAVRVARAVFHLNYRDARMRCKANGDTLQYSSVRTHKGAPPATFEACYRPTGSVAYAEAGSLEAWLTERYCLYAANKRGALWRGEIHHDPWPLQPAEVEVARNTMTDQIGLILPKQQPLLHFAHRLDVVAWLPERVC